MARIGIAGAGVLGRLLAWRLAHAGHRVTVFDPAPGPRAPATGLLASGAPPHAAGFTAAGMLSPLAEREVCGPTIAALGWRSIALWRDIDQALRAEGHATQTLFRQQGSLLLAHGSDRGAAQRVLDRLAHGGETVRPVPPPLDDAQLRALEPGLAGSLQGWWLRDEAQVLPREMLAALAQGARDARWCWGRTVDAVDAHQITVGGQREPFDLAIDTRGLGAKAAFGTTALRGVRGEILWLHAPGVALQRPLRLLHPRHRVYLVARPDDLIVVGASEIESEDRSPVSLRSAVELMAAAHSVLPALAEARIVHMESNLRPALPDHEPQIHTAPGLLRINGLFRHGWLLAPALVDDALARCARAQPEPESTVHV